MRKLHFLYGVVFLSLTACHRGDQAHDASGVFEATEVMVSALASGQILDLKVEEGSDLTADQVVGHIDCDDLALQKVQLEASKDALQLRKVEASPETAVLEKQIATQQANIATLKTQLAVQTKERDRIARLVKVDAAPAKQLDDLQGAVDILQEQIRAAESQLAGLNEQVKSTQRTAAIQNRGILSEDTPYQARIDQVENQIENCTITNPIKGVVLAKYAEPAEFIATGKALYKVADLSKMTLRAYVTGDQLSQIELGQQVHVLTDDGENGSRTYDGTISWIAEKAEFTPKTIQTKSERANLVYAVKISVANDGYIRIGMYGDVEL